MTLTDTQRQAILDEIVKLGAPRRMRAFEFTRRDYRNHTGYTRWQAENWLSQLVDQGLLKEEQVLVNGHWSWIYWRPEDE